MATEQSTNRNDCHDHRYFTGDCFPKKTKRGFCYMVSLHIIRIYMGGVYMLCTKDNRMRFCTWWLCTDKVKA